MTAKRIRKNAHKKIAAIFSNSTTAKAYAEDNGFVGVDVAIEWVKKMAVGRSVKYYDNQNGSYTIRIHSNLWYELYHSNYEVRKKIRESEEPIPVRGIFHKSEKTAKLETQIMGLSHMIDGINIALERAKEIREKFYFNYEPFESSEPLTFSLDTLIELLRKDKGELSDAMKALQKRL